MEVQRSNLFQLEDGAGLSIAVHSQVPQYEYISALIRASGGFVVENELSADFCILSINISNVGAVADELMSEGKLAILDYWIRDSVDAASLLPWYSYQIAPSSFASGNIPQDVAMTLARDVEERDAHELVVTTARYGALLSTNELYKYLSRKCPHRSAASFKHLYETNRSEVESQIVYIRKKLEISLSHNSNFHKRPVISFEPPNKQVALRIQAAPAPCNGNLLPTPTTTADGHDEAMGIAHPGDRRATVPMANDEAPYDPPNMGHVARPVSPRPRRSSENKEAADGVPHDALRMQGVEFEQPQRTQSSAGQTSRPTAQVTAPRGSKPASSLPHGGITDADKLALANFVAQNSQGDKSWPEFMVLFAKKYRRGSIRSVWSWRNIYKMEDVRNMIKDISQGKVVPEPASERKVAPRRIHKEQSDEDEDDEDDEEYQKPRTKKSRTQEPPTAKPTQQELLDNCKADRSAIAKWMLENPKDPATNYKVYLEEFQPQHKTGSVRTPEQWHRFIQRHARAISRIQQNLGTASRAKPPSAPVKVTEEDKQALALWMADKKVTSTLVAYYEAFSKQYRNGSARSPGAWTAVASRISDELDERKRKILLERKKNQGQKQVGTLGEKDQIRIAEKKAQERAKAVDMDSDLSAVESD